MNCFLLGRSLDIGKEGSGIYSLLYYYSCILLSTIFSLASQNELGSETEPRLGKSFVINVKTKILWMVTMRGQEKLISKDSKRVKIGRSGIIKLQYSRCLLRKTKQQLGSSLPSIVHWPNFINCNDGRSMSVISFSKMSYFQWLLT